MSDVAVWLVFGAILAWAIGVVLAVAGSIDAASQRRPVWNLAGHSRGLWLWQALGVVAVPVSLLVSAVYWLRVRPQLVRAATSLGLASADDDPEWTANKRWYDRLFPAGARPLAGREQPGSGGHGPCSPYSCSCSRRNAAGFSVSTVKWPTTVC